MKRRKAREAALQVMYACEISQTPPSENLESFWKNKDASAEIKEFTDSLCKGAWRHVRELDDLISEHTENWSISRLATVDRCILRLAIYELLYRPDIPPPVTINEAIELARKFSTSDSPKFVNAILDKINKVKGNRKLEEKKK
jgi:N utilization substance protein B